MESSKLQKTEETELQKGFKLIKKDIDGFDSIFINYSDTPAKFNILDLFQNEKEYKILVDEAILRGTRENRFVIFHIKQNKLIKIKYINNNSISKNIRLFLANDLITNKESIKYINFLNKNDWLRLRIDSKYNK